jgi:alkylation response protein AidB-like acyl-CoA dehydrogenase
VDWFHRAGVRTFDHMTLIEDSIPTTVNHTEADWDALARTIGRSLAPEVENRDRTGELSVAAFELLRSSGATSALVPAEHGGGGASYAEFGAFLRELGRHDPATAVTLSMHSHLVATQVWRHRHGMDASSVFRKVVDERAVLVSTGASDWVASSGTAVRVDGGYRVTARKGPASGCEIGDVLVTTARWNDAPDGPHVIHCSIPFAAEGVSIDRTWNTLGMRATGSHSVVIADVFVPDAAVSLVRPADTWHPIWNAVLGAAMPLIMSAYLGIADAAVELTYGLVAGRSDPHTLQLIGEMTTSHIAAADLVTAMLTSSNDLNFDNTDDHASRTLARKTVVAEALITTIRLAMEAVGGIGYSLDCDLERLYRDIHGSLFHPLPRVKQHRFTGRVALRLDPSA